MIMGKGHFVSRTKDFDWKGFQEHMGYSDKELKAVKDDPARSNYVQRICSPDMQDKYLICEVVESHGCTAGMKPGDRLYFKGISLIDGKRSDPWCPYIVNPYWFTAGARNLVRQGLDPNSFYVNFSGCMDVGPEHGLGRVVYKVTVVDKSEVEK